MYVRIQIGQTIYMFPSMPCEKEYGQTIKLLSRVSHMAYFLHAKDADGKYQCVTGPVAEAQADLCN